MSVYKANLNAFEAFVGSVLTLYDLDLVVYDEIENFRKFKSD